MPSHLRNLNDSSRRNVVPQAVACNDDRVIGWRQPRPCHLGHSRDTCRAQAVIAHGPRDSQHAADTSAGNRAACLSDAAGLSGGRRDVRPRGQRPVSAFVVHQQGEGVSKPRRECPPVQQQHRRHSRPARRRAARPSAAGPASPWRGSRHVDSRLTASAGTTGPATASASSGGSVCRPPGAAAPPACLAGVTRRSPLPLLSLGHLPSCVSQRHASGPPPRLRDRITPAISACPWQLCRGH